MSPVHYSGEEDLSFRRYSNRGYDYPLSHERGVHRGIGNGSRNYHLSSHDSRNNDHGSEQDSNGQSRRRIPVAVCLQPFYFPIHSLSFQNFGTFCQRNLLSSCSAAAVENARSVVVETQATVVLAPIAKVQEMNNASS